MMASSNAFTIVLFCRLLLLCLFCMAAASSHRISSSDLMIEFSNDSDEKVVVDWQNPKTGERIEFSQLLPGQKMPVKSYANHTFIIHPANETCGDDQVCRGTAVTVNGNDDQGETHPKHSCLMRQSGGWLQPILFN